jgi:hypothetical protein
MVAAGTWTPLRHVYPWGKTIERIIGTLAIPRLDGPVIYVASDYGGAHNASLYETISVLYVDLQASSDWQTCFASVESGRTHRLG